MLTDNESHQLAELLEKIGEHVAEEGRMPYEVFMALWRAGFLTGIDLSIIRRTDRGPEILLALRPDGDPFAGLWHIPGTRVLPGDNALSAMEKRVMKSDLGFTLRREPQFLLQRDIMKGPELTRVTSPVGQEYYRAYLYVLSDDDPEVSENETMKFFPLNEIPYNFLLYQLPTIERLSQVLGE